MAGFPRVFAVPRGAKNRTLRLFCKAQRVLRKREKLVPRQQAIVFSPSTSSGQALSEAKGYYIILDLIGFQAII